VKAESATAEGRVWMEDFFKMMRSPEKLMSKAG
jgi:hypothetical protein